MSDRGRELLERVVAARRRASMAVAEELAALAEFAAADRDDLDPVGEFTHLEVAAVLRVSAPYARARIEFATALTRRPE